ncbi:RNB domain-containing ribonuclease, partial [Salinibacterium sp.]|uniref:RNB domain-containing ribonuclease n=1 Tax=Salinibacterium sp. TaxID=1915057 RepID=UPI00286AA609
AIRDDLEVSAGFSSDVEAEAAATVAAASLPTDDQSAVEFVTIDPEGATDLDQAVHLSRRGEGYLVRYAIAEVPAFVTPGGAVDTEARRRGQTLYAPDGRIPLHPTVISEGAASLLEGQRRGAFVWSFELDAAANVTATTLARAQVRSRHQYSYAEVQALIDDGTAVDSLLLLREVGVKRIQLERERGGASLNRPDEEVEFVAGQYVLVRRSPLPVEEWNAQISLMTGMAAAAIMIKGGIGILRTMPAPETETLENFRRQVAALGCPWPVTQPYGEYLRSIDRDDPRGLAAIHAAASLFRGAGYTAFDGEVPEGLVQAAVAAPYAHTTAPLRRLVDRFVLITCEALVAGTPVPSWVREALPTLPKLMSRADSVASGLDRASVDAIEAALLAARVGETFDAVVISVRNGGGGSQPSGIIQLTDPVVTARVEGAVVAGESIRVMLESADIATGAVVFRA